MVDLVERIAGRRQVEQMIKDDPITVVFHRRERVAVHGGGWRWGSESARPPQEIALIPFKRRMTDFLVNTELGEVVNLPYVFVGRWNLDVEQDDWFTYGGDKYVIHTIDLKTEIRISGQVDYFGRAAQ